ncbi:undecaprenyl/decaprenyl-phosphate alpha-N-acetylglucosaminyl 1-phosphate transferase [Methylomonas sp. SURF-2]|uniref:Undecaprenyl/decaprenyl-phosphate alpha-N-acetylglucosaminyl 1-phosphate transferase n=1 Tax=Methylomonas subterranea TaxID=2952225 RepID=A0ABT1TDE5_9GAMM|nr:MraY family glycosyltransferase [Methylomonas sp. SURF-2]MCQ8103477.1 undecaprenyl/decaprenyl-phosphate alpha-N-acetylglucosaminyl 1-phosphate transferase [Methylomonas sp. SURF-2]
MELFLSFTLSTLISVLLMPFLIKSAKYLGMLDEPDERKVHTQAIPRCGGLGLSFATLTTILVLAPLEQPFSSLLVGGAIIVLFGLLDDIFNLNYKWKFLGQFIAVIFVLQQGIYLKFLPFCGLDDAPLWIAYPLSFIFVVGVTNAVNLSDGLDGLAAGIMLMTLAAVAFFADYVGGKDLALIALAIIGGILGFLRFNSHPAVVFMGDTGSQFIGFMAAFLCIYLVEHVYVTLNPALPLLLLGLPILDTLTVMTQRIYSGKSPFSPDKRHIHHRLLALGFSHAEAVSCIYTLQALFLLAAFLLRYQSDFAVMATWGLICALILSLFVLAAHTGWKARPEHDPSDRRHSILRRFDWLYWTCRLYIEFGLLIYLWVMIFAMYKSFELFSESGPVLLSSLLVSSALVFLFKRPLLNSVVKLCVYITATFSGFLLTSDHFNNPYIDITVAAYLTMLMVVIFIGIRVTRRNVFSFSTQDLLISLFAVAAVLLSDTPFPVNFLFKLLCLAYGIEYLFNFPLRDYKLLKMSALLSGLMVFSVLSQGYDAKSEIFNAETSLSYSAFFSPSP